jgi:WD40 repeat protein
MDATQLAPVQKSTVETQQQIVMIRHSKCGRFVLSADFDAKVRCWDITKETPAVTAEIEGHHGWVQKIVVGENVVYSIDTWGQLRATRFDAGKFSPLWHRETAHDGWIFSLAISPDGKRLVTGGRDGRVRVWNSEDGTQLAQSPDHENEVYATAFSLDGQQVISGDLHGRIRKWEPGNDQWIAEHQIESFHIYERIQDVGGIREIQFLKDGQLICWGGLPTKPGRSHALPTILFLDGDTLKPTRTLELGPENDGYIFDLMQHSAGYLALVTSGQPGAGRFVLLNLEEDEPFFNDTKMSNCHSLSIHPAGRQIIVTATNRSSQGNGAVLDKEGNYLGNNSPMYLFELPSDDDSDKLADEEPANPSKSK